MFVCDLHGYTEYLVAMAFVGLDLVACGWVPQADRSVLPARQTVLCADLEYTDRDRERSKRDVSPGVLEIEFTLCSCRLRCTLRCGPAPDGQSGCERGQGQRVSSVERVSGRTYVCTSFDGGCCDSLRCMTGCDVGSAMV